MDVPAQKDGATWFFLGHVKYAAKIVKVHSTNRVDVRAQIGNKKEIFENVEYVPTGGSREGGKWAQGYDVGDEPDITGLLT